MTDEPDPVLVETVRGGIVEARFRGAYAVSTPDGTIVEAAGDIDRRFLPRSCIKMIQALPLVERGAAARFRLDDRRLALACASHRGAPMHADLAAEWLSTLGLSEADLLCGAHPPTDRENRHDLLRRGEAPSQLHNNCSGKHTGMLCLARHLDVPTGDYIAIDHPVQRVIAETFAEMTGEAAPLVWATDGCSAPNFVSSCRAIAGAMAQYAVPAPRHGEARAGAMARLRDAMMAHPDAVSGKGGASTALMQAAGGKAAVKGGAEGSYTAILPHRGLGIALKMEAGSSAAAEVAMAALLVRHGAVDEADPAVARHLRPVLVNSAGRTVGHMAAMAKLTNS
jgi:L-asparaginase II